MGGRENQLALRILARVDTLLGRLLNAVIHTVADKMHDRILNAVHDVLIHLGVLSDDRKAHVLIQALLHIAHDAVHLLEHAGDGNHPERHGDILQIISQLAQLTA